MCRRCRSRSSRKCNATLVTEHVRVRQTSACKLLRRSSGVRVDFSTLIRTTMVVQLLSFFRTRCDWELTCCESVGQTLRQSKDTSNFALWPALCVAAAGPNFASSCASHSHVKKRGNSMFHRELWTCLSAVRRRKTCHLCVEQRKYRPALLFHYVV